MTSHWFSCNSDRYRDGAKTTVLNDVRSAPGESYQLEEYDFLFTGVRDKDGPNYDGYIADFEITKEGNTSIRFTLKNVSDTMPAKSMMTEAAIDRGVTRGPYIAMGERLTTTSLAVGPTTSKPFVR
ncbi:hypothetical protein O9929_05015 [Vibrio lentus]|nr:hypothetical protein [Vibrio lentus]